MGAWTRSRLRWSPRRPSHWGGDPVAVAPAGSVTEVPRALTGNPPDPGTLRLAVATNAAAGAMFGVGTGEAMLTENQAAAARAVAERVLQHVDAWDRMH